METHEITEPGIVGLLRGEYQGRDKFEGGLSGADFDVKTGLQGYDEWGYCYYRFVAFFNPIIP
ncbi:MAG: hypothetical protein JW715_06335 [Sedimentisphaerales bacterium]|nr:hypothetical protein [Sedimentisphaerales bacterium]